MIYLLNFSSYYFSIFNKYAISCSQSQDIILIVNIVLSDDIQCDIFLDLSIDWQIQEDLSYFDSYELLDIIDNQISQLSNIKINKFRIPTKW